MSVTLVRAVRALKLPPGEKCVLVAFAEHALDDGSNAYPSVPLLEWETGYSQPQLRRIIARLRDLRLLIPETRLIGAGRNRAPVYRVCVENGERQAPMHRVKPIILRGFSDDDDPENPAEMIGFDDENLSSCGGFTPGVGCVENLSFCTEKPIIPELKPIILPEKPIIARVPIDKVPVSNSPGNSPGNSPEQSRGSAPDLQPPDVQPGSSGSGCDPKPAIPAKPARSRASPLACGIPEDFQPSDAMLAWATIACPGINALTETDSMRDWHTARGTRFKDWPAAWRVWMRKAKTFADEATSRGIGAANAARSTNNSSGYRPEYDDRRSASGVGCSETGRDPVNGGNRRESAYPTAAELVARGAGRRQLPPADPPRQPAPPGTAAAPAPGRALRPVPGAG